ncbi:MAG: hypothetical protein HY053_05415 [Proteobacteria bacterium]|nr:hypothetical protein [Pseudomonadota bacterium]
MRPTAAGIYPYFVQPNAPPQGEPLAPLPSNEEEAPPRAPSSANTNDPKAKAAATFSADLAQATATTATATGSSARFIKPDSLLTRLEKAQVEHLRARDAAIKKEATETTGAPTFIYQTGPDGGNYAVGIATPLTLQNSLNNEPEDAPPALTERAFDRGLAAYQLRAGTASPLRAGLIDQAF